MDQKNLKAFKNIEKEDLTAPEIITPEKKSASEGKEKPLEVEKIQSKAEEENQKESKKKGTLEGKIRPQAQVSGKPTTVAASKSDELIQIENILQQDLEDVYFKMEPEMQEKFKTEGEKTAIKIEEYLKKTKIKAGKIFKLILGWLKMVPNVNKFFIKQEAKIKTDRIMKTKK